METMTMNKRDHRKAELERHYATLERLAARCGIPAIDGKKLSVALLKLERVAYQAAEDYCNGQDRYGRPVGSDEWDSVKARVTAQVQALFHGNLGGFFVNGDPRGYALKIKTEFVEHAYKDVGLHRDWGGYGILSPEID